MIVVPLALASSIGLVQDTRVRFQIAAELIVGFLIVQGVGRYDFKDLTSASDGTWS